MQGSLKKTAANSSGSCCRSAMITHSIKYFSTDVCTDLHLVLCDWLFNKLLTHRDELTQLEPW